MLVLDGRRVSAVDLRRRLLDAAVVGCSVVALMLVPAASLAGMTSSAMKPHGTSFLAGLAE